MPDVTDEQFERLAASIRDAATEIDALTVAEILETDDDDLIDAALDEVRHARVVVVRQPR